MELKAVIIEDEKHSRESLKSLLEEFCNGVKVTGMAANVEEGVSIINDLQPELIFLDIELQTGTGFELLEKVTHRGFDVIFTTAFDQYAIRAIKTSSLDYLLKPIDVDELQESIDKALAKRSQGPLEDAQIELLLKNLTAGDDKKKICLATSDGLEFIDVKDIIYCEASGSYTNFYLEPGRKLMVSKNLKEYEHMLPDKQFMRVHNSYLINLQKVKKFVKAEGGYIVMSNNDQVSISQSKRDDFMAKMSELM